MGWLVFVIFVFIFRFSMCFAILWQPDTYNKFVSGAHELVSEVLIIWDTYSELEPTHEGNYHLAYE